MRPSMPPSKRKRKAFCQQLPDDLSAAGSQSRTGCKFALSRRGSRQQQVGHIGAGDEQHESDGPKQNQQWKARIANH